MSFPIWAPAAQTWGAAVSDIIILVGATGDLAGAYGAATQHVARTCPERGARVPSP